MLGPYSLPRRWRNRNLDGDIRQGRRSAPERNAPGLPATHVTRQSSDPTQWTGTVARVAARTHTI